MDQASKHSISGVSRRMLLGGGLAAPLCPAPKANSALATDPVLPLHAAWRAACAAGAAEDARWASLESCLVREIGFPRVAVAKPGTDTVRWVTTHADLDAAADQAGAAVQRAGLHAELDRRQALWAEASRRAGLEDIARRVRAAERLGEDLARRVMACPAASMPGAIAKIELILESGLRRDGDDEFPWSWLRLAIDDLRRLSGLETGGPGGRAACL